jgi:hypothetical protein
MKLTSCISMSKISIGSLSNIVFEVGEERVPKLAQRVGFRVSSL